MAEENNYYYEIAQYFDGEVKYSIIPEPANKTHIKRLITYMAGDINVYLVNDKNNSKQNLTDELVLKKQTFDELYTINWKAKKYIGYGSSATGAGAINYIGTLPKKNGLDNIFMEGDVWQFHPWIGLYEKNTKKEKRNIRAGLEYERFIGEKYEKEGYSVVYHGVEKGLSDQGIDIVAENDDRICLVQCKNWLDSNQYRIKHKDIRAFIGDCYIYIRENNITKKVSMHFIVSDEKILDKGAKFLLENRNIVKYKIVPFENVQTHPKTHPTFCYNVACGIQFQTVKAPSAGKQGLQRNFRVSSAPPLQTPSLAHQNFRVVARQSFIHPKNFYFKPNQKVSYDKPRKHLSMRNYKTIQ
eukprot:TRINITY_DN137397_c0_g1_i1.p2 TRINITY_DN137397_c0_g1~~TRINITY_DN137397_c0_g1_i1.p2  ORF type:complete len:381 (-),score=5.39 TRINITY_DN137397_c0_g1_i1:402-1469(-)